MDGLTAIQRWWTWRQRTVQRQFGSNTQIDGKWRQLDATRQWWTARRDGKHGAMAMDGAMASQRLGKVRQLLNGPRAQRGWTAMDGAMVTWRWWWRAQCNGNGRRDCNSATRDRTMLTWRWWTIRNWREVKVVACATCTPDELHTNQVQVASPMVWGWHLCAWLGHWYRPKPLTTMVALDTELVLRQGWILWPTKYRRSMVHFYVSSKQLVQPPSQDLH